MPKRKNKGKKKAAKLGDAPPDPMADLASDFQQTQAPARPRNVAALIPSTASSPRSQVLSLAESVQSLKISPQKRVGDMVARPGFGSVGRQIHVYANFFRLEYKATIVHQYDVDIQPAAPPARGGRGRGRGRRGGRGGGRSVPQGPVKLKKEVIELVYKELDKGGKTFPVGSSFDGSKNLYIPGRRIEPIKNYTVSVKIDDKPKNFSVSVTHSATVNLMDLEACMSQPMCELPATVTAALDVALRHVASMQGNNITLNGAIYKLDNLAKMISPGVQAWAGYTQSVRPCQLGLVLNMNSCFTPMIKQQTVAEFIKDYVDQQTNKDVPLTQLHQHLTDAMYARMASKLDKLKVKTIHNPRREVYKKMAGFTKKSAAETYFENDRKQRVSVVQYMRQSNNYEVKYPHLRLVPVYKGNEVSHVAFPPECVQIRGVPYRRRELTIAQKEKLIKAATQKPNEKKTYIEQTLKTQLRNAQHKRHIEAWGLKINPEMEEIPVRVLPHPALEGGDEEYIDVQGKGEWDVDGYKFKKAMSVNSWALVNFCLPQNLNQKIGDLFKQLMDTMKRRGMHVADKPYKLDVDKKDMYKAGDILKMAADGAASKFECGCQIIMCIMPDFVETRGRSHTSTEDLYTEIKVASDQLTGIPSQCLLTTNAGLEGKGDHNRKAYVANLVLKINAKLGGVNSVLFNIPESMHDTFAFPILGDRPFMVMGADLTHPPPSSDEKRSVVGIVASMDKYLSRYACRTHFQPEGLESGREVIKDLKAAAKELLLAYYRRNNGLKPEAILFYRDGVSQGEFAKVVQHEYKAIRDACAEMGDSAAEYCPPITFITVQKRHNVRGWAKIMKDTDSSGNLPAGSCIDSHICHPHSFDFYLYSHAGIIGTSRPALYSVLVDEVGFDPDSLQCLTYWMCHLFCRCTRSVSYCPPAYYAHHAAARGKLLLCNASKGVKQHVHRNLLDELFFV